jgi:hypothetical protein
MSFLTFWDSFHFPFEIFRGPCAMSRMAPLSLFFLSPLTFLSFDSHLWYVFLILCGVFLRESLNSPFFDSQKSMSEKSVKTLVEDYGAPKDKEKWRKMGFNCAMIFFSCFFMFFFVFPCYDCCSNSHDRYVQNRSEIPVKIKTVKESMKGLLWA